MVLAAIEKMPGENVSSSSEESVPAAQVTAGLSQGHWVANKNVPNRQQEFMLALAVGAQDKFSSLSMLPGLSLSGEVCPSPLCVFVPSGV